MQTVRALPRGTGDYVHPDENVRIIDEATGEAYDLILKGEAERPGEKQGIRVFIPAKLIQDLLWADGYCVVELQTPANDQEADKRAEWLQNKLMNSS